jgi:hypothetical protein
MNSHLVCLFCDDLRAAVGTLVTELKPVIAAHLPAPPPRPPEDILITGGGSATTHAVVQHVRSPLEGRVRVVATAGRDGLISIEAHDGSDWVEVWRSDVPTIVPQRAAAPAANPSPAPEAPSELTSRNFGPVQPGQVIEVDGRFTVVK